jgi:GAF domain-containing protein
MAQRASTKGERGKVRRRKPKRGRSSPRHRSTAELQKQLRESGRELAETRRQLLEALKQQTATSEVLKVVSSSPRDLHSVFQTMLAHAVRICGAQFGTLFRFDGRKFDAAAFLGAPPDYIKFQKKRSPFLPAAGTPLEQLARTKEIVRGYDLSADKNPPQFVRVSGTRSHIAVPMVKDTILLGALVIYRQEILPFTNKQIEVVQNFAAQAVIAIENARLLNELRGRTDDLSEALELQTATSEVLSVISSSPGELAPVFKAMLENAVRVCGAKFGNMFSYDGANFRIVAHHNASPEYDDWLRSNHRWSRDRVHPETPLAQIARNKTIVQIENLKEGAAYVAGDPRIVALVELGGARAFAGVPIVNEGTLIGAITIYDQEVRPFTDRQIDLLKNFAAQAVIAIENTRLLNELRQRTGDLTEALEQQTATSEVLNVISSSVSDAHPVFDTIVQSGLRLFPNADVFIALPENGKIRPVAMAVKEPSRAEAWKKRFPIPLSREYMHGLAILDRRMVDLPDGREAPPDLAAGVKNFLASGYRAVTIMPMVRGGEAIGLLSVVRMEPGSLSEKQRSTLKSFADQAVIAIENARLLNELRERTDDLTESLEQQTATSEVLKVISSSPGQLEPVFQAMLENAVRICDAKFGNLWLREGNGFRAAAMVNAPVALAEERQRAPVIYPTSPRHVLRRVAANGKAVQVLDLMDDKEATINVATLGGARTIISVPMLKDGEMVGAIGIYRQEVRSFTEKQIQLVSNFAAQAVIAIENARLLNELHQRTDDLTEALEQQTATSEVLRVISNSAGELQPVFESILTNAVRLCEAGFGTLWLAEGDRFRAAAWHNLPTALAASRRDEPALTFDPSTGIGRVVATKKVAHVEDMSRDSAYLAGNPRAAMLVEKGGARTVMFTPMLKDDNEVIGVLTIFRQEVRPFTEKQIELVQNFAAQALIAIENTRLLNELRESLQQQTATADVLKVISRSAFDLQMVLETLVGSAARLCEADMVSVTRPHEGGNAHYHVATFGFSSEWFEAMQTHPLLPERGTLVGRTLLEKQTVHIADVLADPEYTSARAQQLGGFRAVLGVPLLREGVAVGVFMIARKTPQAFTAKQIELATTFADQALIAIENVRLFDEVQARTNELSEALEQQTATSEVLKVISSAPGSLDRVFQSMLENAVRICQAKFGVMFRFYEEGAEAVATVNLPAPAEEFLRRRGRLPATPGSDLDMSQKTKQVVRTTDMAASSSPSRLAKVANVRTQIAVPLVKDDTVIGAITIYRQEVLPFTEKQVELLANFAAQAVIAIENARLLSELRESLQQQTATADVLKVISRSTFDLMTVLDTLLQSAGRLCDADQGTVTQKKGDQFYRTVAFGFPPAFLDYVKDLPVEPSRETGTGRALVEGKVVHIHDVNADPDYTWGQAQRLGGFRTMLCVPMLREGRPAGVLTLTRTEVRPFTDKQIELVATFADQAAIAIENVRLFESVEARTRELAQSLEDLETAQDRLVQTQKLASLGQLTAGIAHEIKNPLNFVNNFSAISTDLLDELRGALQLRHYDDKARSEIEELMDTLRGNLKKIEQHGKRADSIVKNMLLHSREGSGQHRPVDINAVVEESLNLAYHGARAEKQGFNITLERSFDPAAGEVDLFPQEITRVLLNLISNGFYAATKRKAEVGDGGYEPTLAAATKNLGDRVEIRIRDNGTGIPPQVKDRMFNPFFTTKPPGEGTGLGLSLSYDIIVKQHAGLIEVDTTPGEFTEFRIILPRTAASIAKTGGRA